MRFEYRSPARFVIHQLAFLPQFRLALERLDQFLFSQRTLIREQRIAVLYRAHDATIQNPNFRVSSWELMGLLYGPRWVWHPEKATLRNYYDLVLRSLVESGDMVSDEGSYRLAPKAIDTLARYEEENRRHRDQVRVQKWLCYITTGLVITAIVQILVAWIK